MLFIDKNIRYILFICLSLISLILCINLYSYKIFAVGVSCFVAFYVCATMDLCFFDLRGHVEKCTRTYINEITYPVVRRCIWKHNFSCLLCGRKPSPLRFNQASWRRAAERTRAQINAVIKRVWLNLVVNKLSNDNVGEVKRDSFEEENNKLLHL